MPVLLELLYDFGPYQAGSADDHDFHDFTSTMIFHDGFQENCDTQAARHRIAFKGQIRRIGRSPPAARAPRAAALPGVATTVINSRGRISVPSDPKSDDFLEDRPVGHSAAS